MQFNAVKEPWGTGNQRWLGSAHGTSSAQTVTLDASKLTKYKEAGMIPAGTPLKVAAAGKFEPVTAASDELAGFLLTDQSVAGAGDVIAPMLDHGRIRVDYLPQGAFDVTKLTTPTPHFIFSKEAN